MLVIALIALVSGLLAQHLGLSEAVANRITKVAKCHRCLVFWITLIVLALCHYNLIIAIGLSLLNSYISNWFGLGLIWLNKQYNRVWERLNK